MCTILILLHSHDAAPLVVAANRDELYERPTAPPGLLRASPPRAVGGRDLMHGGSWLGLNESGLVVALTNMRSAALERRSRGEIVTEALECRDLEEVDRRLTDLTAQYRYRPFNLFYGTAQGARVAYLHDDGLAIDTIAPGGHVLPSHGVLDDPDLPGVARGLERLEVASRAVGLDALCEQLKRALADHAAPAPEQLPAPLRDSPFGVELEARVQALCVHTERYGTRSANVVVVGGGRGRFYACDGPPCTGTWRRYDALLGSEGQPERFRNRS